MTEAQSATRTAIHNASHELDNCIRFFLTKNLLTRGYKLFQNFTIFVFNPGYKRRLNVSAFICKGGIRTDHLKDTDIRRTKTYRRYSWNVGGNSKALHKV